MKEKVTWSPGTRFYNFNNGKITAFIHIPKCGGSSVNNFLKDYLVDFDYEHLLKGNSHKTYLEIEKIIRDTFPKKEREYFAIVRNPWERVLSFYHMARIKGRSVFPKDNFQHRKNFKGYKPQWDYISDVKNNLGINRSNVIQLENINDELNQFLKDRGIDLSSKFPLPQIIPHSHNGKYKKTIKMSEFDEKFSLVREEIRNYEKEIINLFNYSLNKHKLNLNL